jgi:hypothetical protein
MTTIAWDGTLLAADRLGDSGGFAFEVSKIFELGDGRILGIAGDYAVGSQIADYLAGVGERPDFEPGMFEGILIEDGEAYLMQSRLVPIPVKAPHAIGSGRDYAIAAMRMGGSAIYAVEVASEYDPESGFGVEAYEIEEVQENDAEGDMCCGNCDCWRSVVNSMLSRFGITIFAQPSPNPCAFGIPKFRAVKLDTLEWK